MKNNLGNTTEESRKEMSRPRCGKPPDVNKVSCGNSIFN